MRRLAVAGLLALGLNASPPGAAQPLALAWGVIAEPAAEAAATPQTINEHLEFLLAHGWRPLRLTEVESAGAASKSVLLTFDDPASAALYVLPLLELYEVPAVVTVSAFQAADPALAKALGMLARSPWIELVPRVEPVANPATPLRCGPPAAGTTSLETTSAGQTESALRASLTAQLARLRGLSSQAGRAPTAVAWAPGTWDGAAEAVASSLGLTLQLPTFEGVPPHLVGARVGRTAIAPWAGVWALAQAAARWDPDRHLVRFVEVDAAWICTGGDPQARLARIVAVVRSLDLNGVRLVAATDGLVDIAGQVAHALRAAGVAWVAVDLGSTGNADHDVALAGDLAAALDFDVAILPAGAGPSDRLAGAVRAARPAIRLAWRHESGPGERAFRLAPTVPAGSTTCGATVSAPSVATTDRMATDLAIAGCEWIGLDVELAELGLRDSLRSLAAFALPGAGKTITP